MKRTVTVLIDDLDRESEADETVRFTLDGITREVDLTAEYAAEFRALLDPYVRASRRVGGRKRRSAR